MLQVGKIDNVINEMQRFKRLLTNVLGISGRPYNPVVANVKFRRKRVQERANI